MENKIYATRLNNGKIAIFDGVSCPSGYCKEYGCDFPNCANFTGEEFDSEEDAKVAYKDLEIV
jgi:hypothetical protein